MKKNVWIAFVVTILLIAQPIFASTDFEPTISTKPVFSNIPDNVSNIGDSLRSYVGGEILVKYKKSKINLDSTSGNTKSINLASAQSLEKKEDLKKNNISILVIKDGSTVEQKIAEIEMNSSIEYAQPNYQYYAQSIPSNDVQRASLWGLNNTGQTVEGVLGTVDADIDGPEAWAINEGTNATNSIIVAVIDDGIAYNHPDLVSNMWNGVNCVSDTNIFLGNCMHGYDFEDNDKNPLPSGTHGTHVAGTIAATKNNSFGIIGVAPQAKLMALKSSLTTIDNIRAIDFAKHNGAKVINASFAGTNFDQALKDAIDAFPGIFVAAAGNNSRDNTITAAYPSDFTSANIISVAATDQNDLLASFSNYSLTSVDIGAPGVNILSTIPGTSTPLFENFEGVTVPALPAVWTTEGTLNNWGTFDRTADFGAEAGNVLYGDLDYPYASSSSTTVTSPEYDLSASGATISFLARCDTEYDLDNWTDYMQLEYSADGSSFSVATNTAIGEIFRWDESTLDLLNGEDPLNSNGISVYRYSDIPIPSQYLSANFKFRFLWFSDASDNLYDACSVDDITIERFSDGTNEQYEFVEGTSMAAPHVSGLAALIMGYNSTLSTSAVKNAILTTGDSVPSLLGKTVTGKRINALNALQSVAPGRAIVAFNLLNPSIRGFVNEGAKTVSLTVPFGTNVAALTPTISVSTGALISPLSGVAQNFSSPVTYTVTSLASTTQAYVVTVRALSATQSAPDINGIASLSSTTPVVVITNPNQQYSITVPGVVANPLIDVSAFIAQGGGTLPEILIYSPVADVAFQNGTTITSDTPGWTGIISGPKISTVLLPSDSAPKTVTAAIEIGTAGARFSFDRAVRILLPNQAGKKAGYVATGLPFTEITVTCEADSSAAGNALGAGGECKRDVGADLVIWTKHFTKFVAFTQISNRGGGSATRTRGSKATITAPNSSATGTDLKASAKPIKVNNYQFYRDLTLGLEGVDVTELQNRLTREGVYSGPVTGYFGSLTLVAVRAYQNKVGIRSTGNVGPLTRNKLNAEQTISTVVNNSNDSTIAAQIAALQARIMILSKQLAERLNSETTKR